MTTTPDPSLRSASSRLALMTAVAAVGALDTGIFIATDPHTALKTPGRTRLVGLAVIHTLAGVGGARTLIDGAAGVAVLGLVVATRRAAG